MTDFAVFYYKDSSAIRVAYKLAIQEYHSHDCGETNYYQSDTSHMK